MVIKKYICEILISFMFLSLLFYSSNPILYDDSTRYLKGYSPDLPLYSIIINILLLTFNSLNSIVVFQAIFLCVGIIFFTRTITIQFNLSLITKIFIAIFLFIPTVKFYNYLLTEPLSFALSLFFISFIIKLIYNFNFFNLILSALFIIALLLVRKQFIILYPLILIIYIGIFMAHTSKKTFILLAISFMSIFIIHNSLLFFSKYKNSNSYDRENSFNSDHGIFKFLFIDAIYISDFEVIKLFENESYKIAVSKILKEIDLQKASIKFYNGRGHYGNSYSIIKNVDVSLNDLAQKENTTINILKKKISIKIISANYLNYMKLIFKKFYDATWLFIFVPFFMLVPSLFKFIKHKTNFSLVITFISLFALANHSVVVLFGRVQPRYLIYSDFVLLIFIFISFLALQNKNKINS